MKTLTIIIENLKDGPLKGIWDQSIKDAKKTMGFQFEQVDEIRIDSDTLLERYEDQFAEILADLISSAITAHSLQHFENTYNK